MFGRYAALEKRVEKLEAQIGGRHILMPGEMLYHEEHPTIRDILRRLMVHLKLECVAKPAHFTIEPVK